MPVCKPPDDGDHQNLRPAGPTQVRCAGPSGLWLVVASKPVVHTTGRGCAATFVAQKHNFNKCIHWLRTHVVLVWNRSSDSQRRIAVSALKTITELLRYWHDARAA